MSSSEANRSEPDRSIGPAPGTPLFVQPSPAALNALQGPLGLRAGWGILLFFVLASMLGFALFVGLFKGTGRMASFQKEQQGAQVAAAHAKAAHQHAISPPAGVSTVFLLETAQTGAVLLAALGISYLERRRFAAYGLAPRHLRDMLPGAITGLLAIAALVGLLRGLHLLVFDGRLLEGATVFRFGAAWLLTFLLVGVFEEFLFRGYIQFTLMRGLLGLGDRVSPAQARKAAFWIAATAWSLLFSATHLSNAGEDPMGLAMVFVAGILFSYALWRTGSLWWGIGFHMTWDWGQSFLFGVRDSGNLSAGRLFATHASGHPLLSGGLAGPEGSVFVLPVLLLVGAVIRLHPQAVQPAVEPLSVPLVERSPLPERIP